MTSSTRSGDAHDDALRELMVAYQSGDLAAFDRLYFAIEQELRGFFRARCHDPYRVDDLLQETFLQIHRSRRAYLPGLPVRPWVYAIAKRVFPSGAQSAAPRIAGGNEPGIGARAGDSLRRRPARRRWALKSALRRVPGDGRRAACSITGVA
jgi:DNA-directed RNA polymerase specialized sigma24 family protein